MFLKPKYFTGMTLGGAWGRIEKLSICFCLTRIYFRIVFSQNVFELFINEAFALVSSEEKICDKDL